MKTILRSISKKLTYMNIKTGSSLWLVLSSMLLISTPVSAMIDMGCSPTLADPCTGYPSIHVPRGPSPEEQRHEQARLLNVRANAAHAAGRYDEAIELYREALGLDPDEVIYLNNISNSFNSLGVDASNRGDSAQAITYYKQALEINPSNAIARENLDRRRQWLANERAAAEQAKIDEELDRQRQLVEDKAREARDKVKREKELIAENIRNLINTGNEFFESGDFDKAIEIYNQAQAIDPDNEAAFKNIRAAEYNTENALERAYNQGTYEYEQGDFAAAVKTYQAVIDRFKHTGNYQVALPEMLARAQEQLAAIERENRPLTEKISSYWTTTTDWISQAIKNMHTDNATKSGCSPSQDANVVDLCFDEEKEPVDPSPTEIPNVSEATMKFINSARDVAEKLGWEHDEISRLHKSIQDLEAKGDVGAEATMQEIDDIWVEMLAREIGWTEFSSKGVGPGMPVGAGQQLGNMDCAIFALANATGKPYGVVGTLAAELIRQGDWRKDKELHKNPQDTIERIGLTGGEVLMLTEALGQVEVVDSKDFTKTLEEGYPIMVNVVPQGAKINKDGVANKGHQVVLIKSFQYGGTWYEMMDSNQGPIQSLYLSESQLMQIIQERGIVYKPDPFWTVKFLR